MPTATVLFCTVYLRAGRCRVSLYLCDFVTYHSSEAARPQTTTHVKKKKPRCATKSYGNGKGKKKKRAKREAVSREWSVRYPQSVYLLAASTTITSTSNTTNPLPSHSFLFLSTNTNNIVCSLIKISRYITTLIKPSIPRLNPPLLISYTPRKKKSHSPPTNHHYHHHNDSRPPQTLRLPLKGVSPIRPLHLRPSGPNRRFCAPFKVQGRCLWRLSPSLPRLTTTHFFLRDSMV